MKIMEELDDIPYEDDKLINIRKPFKVKFISFLNRDITPSYNSEILQNNQSQQTIFFSFKINNQNFLENNEQQRKQSSDQEKKLDNSCINTINNNLPAEQGNIYYHNGTNFKGFYGNKKRVQGHFKFQNGFQYVGECQQNSFSGEGSLIFPSGKIISGNWNNFQIVGRGKIEYPNGQAYYGQIKDFKKHGYGQFFFKDGSKYVGDFYFGLISGYGTYFIDDQVVCKGIWINGQLEQSQQIKQRASTQDEWLQLSKLSTVNQERQSTHHFICSMRTEGVD